MTLIEYISSHMDEFLYVGSGANFFAIGLGRDILPHIATQTDRYHTMYENALKSAELDARTLPKRIAGYEKRIAESEQNIVAVKEELKNVEAEFEKFRGKDKLTLGNQMSIKTLLLKKSSMTKTIESLEFGITEDKRKLKGRRAEMKCLPKRLKYNKQRLENWTSLYDRNVQETYPRKLAEPVGTIVLVAGDEVGEFWDYDEFLTAVRDGRFKERININHPNTEETI